MEFFVVIVYNHFIDLRPAYRRSRSINKPKKLSKAAPLTFTAVQYASNLFGDKKGRLKSSSKYLKQL